MALDHCSRAVAATTFDDVWIQGALHQKFGIGDKDSELLAVFLDADDEMKATVYGAIVGDRTDMSDLSKYTDSKEIAKVQKLQNVDETYVNGLLISRPGVKDIVV